MKEKSFSNMAEGTVSKYGVIDGVNLDKPKFDQSTFGGRAKHFLLITNPLNVLLSKRQLDEAKRIVQGYRTQNLPDGLTPHDLWKAKYRYDSAFHPDTGEKMLLIGRMSAQVPMNMIITGFMMTFYKTTPQVILWQGLNQSFNAVVNYTNRSGDEPIPLSALGIAYVTATGSATATAVGLNSLVKSLPPLVGRIVPFCAVAASNFVNIPCMRFRELKEGIPVFTENGERIGESIAAANRAIPMVVVSRIMMASPGMIIPALIMNHLDRGRLIKRFPWTHAPIQIGICGICLAFATPLCCALFPQKSSIPLARIEPELQRKAAEMGYSSKKVYFNKGL